MPKPSRGKVFIRIFQSQQQVSVMVEDNGVGRKEKPESENSFSTSQGILLTDRRLKLLYPGSKIIIEDLNTPEGNPSGTKVTLKLSIS